MATGERGNRRLPPPTRFPDAFPGRGIRGTSEPRRPRQRLAVDDPLPAQRNGSRCSLPPGDQLTIRHFLKDTHEAP